MDNMRESVDSDLDVTAGEAHDVVGGRSAPKVRLPKGFSQKPKRQKPSVKTPQAAVTSPQKTVDKVREIVNPERP